MIPGSGRPPGEGNGYWLQYSCLENSTDRGAWWATAHGFAESDMTERLIPSFCGAYCVPRIVMGTEDAVKTKTKRHSFLSPKITFSCGKAQGGSQSGGPHWGQRGQKAAEQRRSSVPRDLDGRELPEVRLTHVQHAAEG